MDEKPKMNFQRFRSAKMNKKYLLKFALYVVILVSLWIWYAKVSPNSAKNETPKTEEVESLELNNVIIEP